MNKTMKTLIYLVFIQSGSLLTSKNKIDCYTVLENVSLLWQIGGIFPVIVLGSTGYKKCTFNWFLSTYNFILFVICCGVLTKGWYKYEETIKYVYLITNAR